LLVALLAGCLIVPACRGKGAQGTYDRVRNGMTFREVATLLGNGQAVEAAEVPGLAEDEHLARVLGEARWSKWQEGGQSVYVGFVTDRVVYRTRTDP
jgi:hypothetical protein